MSTIGHPVPPLDTLGFGVMDPPQQALAPAQTPSGATIYARSPIYDMLPDAETLRGGFTELAVTNGLSVPAGHSALYPLIDVSVDDVFGHEVGVFGVDLEQLPPDVTSSGDYLAWGTTQGSITNYVGGCAIVVGTDLPLQAGAWTVATVPIVGVETAANLVHTSRRDRIDWCIGFPPGSLADTTPLKRSLARVFSPYIYRYTRMQRIQAALVVRGSFLAGATNKKIRGLVDLKLLIGDPVHRDAPRGRG